MIGVSKGLISAPLCPSAGLEIKGRGRWNVYKEGKRRRRRHGWEEGFLLRWGPILWQALIIMQGVPSLENAGFG